MDKTSRSENKILHQTLTKCEDLLRELTLNNNGQFVIAPTHLNRAHCLILTWTTKAGLFVGASLGKAVMFTRNAATSHWSAPIFLKCKAIEAGISFGAQKSSGIIVALSASVVKEILQSDSHVVFGVDRSFALPYGQSMTHKSDFITIGSGDHSLISMTVERGLMMGFSFSNASLYVDKTIMKDVYGPIATVAEIVSEVIPPPEELRSFYDRLTELCQRDLITISPARMSASLERMTAGFDPDRRIITSDARVVHRGDSKNEISSS